MRPEWLLYRTGHGLIDQSLGAREMDHPINGDGFGMGWYATAPSPGVYGRWLFVPNGFIDGYPELRRELMLAVEPD